jgi:protoporphyrinogen oxidase
MGHQAIILGGGVTGLAAGIASGLPVYEAAAAPGGICSSYYVRPGARERLPRPPPDGEAYRFEIGGGHWIFGGDPLALRFIRSLTPLESYQRRSAVYLPGEGFFVPFPIQNHLRFLGPQRAARALAEMERGSAGGGTCAGPTMAEWLEASFGPMLSDLFFHPFHELYTAGLWRRIAPQDGYKSPVDLAQVRAGALQGAGATVAGERAGYNATFFYPPDGLDAFVRAMAERCDIRYGKRAVAIDLAARLVRFADGSAERYDVLLATLPLNRLTAMASLDVGEGPDPSQSVLVVNLGAVKGPRCPEEQWVYVPASRSGFHRVGFYDHVDTSFLPTSMRAGGRTTSVYVERSYPDGRQPSADEVETASAAIIRELQDWGWVGKVDAVDPTFIDVAYTWAWPGSRWRRRAMGRLEERGIYPIGRFARWKFQGIADSLRDGLMAGAAFGAS